ncbi:hypothetical protein GCM10028789_10770 [Sinomonas halotolerans]
MEVHSITAAAPAHSVDMHQRMVRYAVAMGIRMVCILLLFVLDGWWKIAAVAGAVFLPWVAVVIANAGTQAEVYESEAVDSVPFGELPAAPPSAEAGAAAGETIQGETVPEEDVPDEDGDGAQDGVTAPRDDEGRPGGRQEGAG